MSPLLTVSETVAVSLCIELDLITFLFKWCGVPCVFLSTVLLSFLCIYMYRPLVIRAEQLIVCVCMPGVQTTTLPNNLQLNNNNNYYYYYYYHQNNLWICWFTMTYQCQGRRSRSKVKVMVRVRNRDEKQKKSCEKQLRIKSRSEAEL